MSRCKYRFEVAAAALLLSLPAIAQVVIVPPNPQVGSRNPATAEPPVRRPHTKPCVVKLFTNLAFADFTPKMFSYAPPSDCPAPWAKVVFTADFTVTAGRQFDRTAAFYVGHANVYYGTTAEPSKTFSPSWHVERDVTDLSAIFKSDQSGEAILGNLVNSTYTSIIYADAALEFYPVSHDEHAPRTPDIVVPTPDAEGGAVTLNTTSSQLTQPVMLPMNVERVYLDVITQSQIGDEFWYTCAPNDVASELETCGNTAFREAEISIDGQPAGVAPVYPWIYTGGIDPYLWRPIPGVQALDFVPYRVDLTPFAGLLADGSQHTIALSVYNANNYFLATANLLVFTDHGAKKVSGAILSNDLAAEPTPVVDVDLATNNGTTSGTVSVSSNRKYSISGYVQTSHGRIETTVEQKIEFVNNQQYVVNATTDDQNIKQSTEVEAETITKDGFIAVETKKKFSYPLLIDYSFVANTDGTYTQKTTVDQGDDVRHHESINGFPIYESKLENEVKSTDTLYISASFSITGNSGQHSSQRYFTKNSLGYCYSRIIAAVANVLTEVKDGEGCECDRR